MTPTPVPILLYHSIADRAARRHAGFTVPPAVFRDHVRAIRDAGRTPLTVSAFAAALRGERPLPARPLLVTFDDGFADVRPAVELLLDSGLGATVFVTTGTLESEGMLTHAGLCALAALGDQVEIGAHSVTHPRLDELSAERAAAEICVSKTALESVIGRPLHSFAYPHGAHDRGVRAAVIDAGFGAAAAVRNAISHTGDDVYALARVTITSRSTAREIELLLAGSGAPRARRRERAHTRGYRWVRRARRALGRGRPTWP